MFLRYLFEEPSYYFCWLIAVMFSVCLHEYCHAYAARCLGDDTARSYGFMTMNPLKVMGSFSLVCLFCFGIAWGSIPVDSRMIRKRWHFSLIALSGPAANLLLAILFSLLSAATSRLLPARGPALYYLLFCHVGMLSNCLLFILNILPIPSFDGWNILEPLSKTLQGVPHSTRNTITFAVFLLLWTVPPVSRLLWGLTGLLAASIRFITFN